MTIPAGAYAVAYEVHVRDESDADPEIFTNVQFPVDSPYAQGAPQDAAAQAAMEAYSSSLQTAYPALTVYASRQYLCRAAGDAWPT
jgi:hypothetical protein